MADSKYSLDSILSQYPKGSSTASAGDLDDILNSYPATKHYEDSGLADIFDSRKSTTDIDLSGINISLQADYPSPEEIKKKRQPAEEELSEEDKLKLKKQVDYEILSGDYDRKYMPDELKTSAELKAEREHAERIGGSKKKVKVKPVKKKFGLDFDDIPGIHSNDDDDDLLLKYGRSPLYSINDDNAENEKEHIIPFEIEKPAGRSFSEKVAMEDEYKEKYSSSGHNSAAKTPKPAAPVKKEPEKKDPLGKYAAFEQKNNLDEIIEQYERKDRIHTERVKTETSAVRGITGIFNKLMAKEENADNEGSELLENAKKLKKSSSAPAVSPIERKQISDIDLDLKDKMIQDTTQISQDKANAEQDKLNALRERRNKKVQEFVLMGDDDDLNDEAEDDENADIEDFESLSDEEEISKHIEGQKNKLVLRLLMLIVCFAVTAYLAIANDFELPIINTFTVINKHMQPDVFLFLNSLIGVIAGIISYQTVANGMAKLFALKADCDTLSAVALVSSLVTSMISLADSNMVRGSYVYIYTPAAIGALIFNTIGKLLIISRTQRSFSFISGDNERYAMFMVRDEEQAQNFTRGALTDFPELAAMQKTDVIEDFLKTSYASDSTDRFCKAVAPIVSLLGLVIAAVAGFMAKGEHSSMGAFCVGLSTFSACSSICSCYAMMLVVNLPMNKASVKVRQKQGAILGFDCIDEFCETNSILVDAAQLFPMGSIKLTNIKPFPDTSIDEAIIEAASLTSQSGSILNKMFYDIIVGKTEMLNPVESYLYEDSMGLCGWINNKRVLLGNRELMQNHSIEGLPSIAKENEYTGDRRIAVYLSISGQLSAMFIIELMPAYQIGSALRELEKNHISVMLRSVDSMLSIDRLAELFGVSPSMFKLIPFRLHPDFEKVTEYTKKRPATMACSGRFASFAQLILSANRLRGTISGGIAMQAASMLLGILLTLTMVLLNSMQELTVTNVLLYNFAFVIMFYIFQMFRKS